MKDPVADTFHCQVEDAEVRAEQVETLRALIRQLFMRRNHSYTAGQEKMWLRAELVQSLREASAVYRTMSTKTSGPLLFELGYFRIRPDRRLELTTNTLPNAHPKPLTRLLSEFVAPGARLRYAPEEGESVGWTIHGIDDLAPIDSVES